MLADLVCDLTYVFRYEFSTTSYFFAYCGLLILRLGVYPCLMSIFYLQTRVIKKKPTSYLYDINQEQRAKLQTKFVRDGLTLHGFSLPSFLSLGFYRILPIKNFTSEVGLGFASDFIYILFAFFV